MKDDSDLKTLAAPTPNETYNTTKTKKKRVQSRRRQGPDKPNKNLSQFAVKVRPVVKAIFEEAADARPEITKGELLEEIIEFWSAANEQELSPRDKAKGRSDTLTFPLTPGFKNAIHAFARENKWSLGECLEDMFVTRFMIFKGKWGLTKDRGGKK